MNWRQVDEYYAVSDCGFYTVTKQLEGPEPLYHAWYRYGAQPSSVTNKASTWLGRKSDSTAAARLCGAHQRQFNPVTALPDAELDDAQPQLRQTAA